MLLTASFRSLPSWSAAWRPLPFQDVVRLKSVSRWTRRQGELRDGRTYTCDHYRLDGRSPVRVHTGQGRDSRQDLYQDCRTDVWDNRSDTATLRNHRARFVDDHSWGHHRHGDHR
ncbi:hypothetical protein GCM10010377_77880 [Streptomyces viridiviolaceus]|nr:hypothetical protein GCM10010377_77880 [Streptomyces viridiviolaceus]